MTPELEILPRGERQLVIRSQAIIRSLDKKFSSRLLDQLEDLAEKRAERSGSVPLGRFTIGLRADRGAVLARAIGIKVKAIRQHRQLTQAELARRSGIARANIARIEAGAHSPTVSTLKRVAHALGIRFSTLVEEPSYSATREDDKWLNAGLTEWSESLRREDRRR